MTINEIQTDNPVANYIYNSNGELIQKTVNGKQTNYFYQRDFLLYETDSDNNITREYIWSEQGYPIAFIYQGNMYYYHTNYRGDVLAITDQNATIVAEYSYDAWGNILSQSGDLADINPLRYAGYYYDDETKFYYLMNRYYNPEHGVFISLDPDAGSLYDPISQNGYIYADNNPVMLIDITGDEAITAGIAISYILASGGATYMVVEAVKKIDEIGQDISGFLAANKKAKAPEGDTVTSNEGDVYDNRPSKDHSTTTENPITGQPNSSVDILDKNVNVVRRRWFGRTGKQVRDVDYTNHGNPKEHPEWPHEHGPTIP